MVVGWAAYSLPCQGLWVFEECYLHAKNKISTLIHLFVILKSQTFKERIKISFL